MKIHPFLEISKTGSKAIEFYKSCGFKLVRIENVPPEFAPLIGISPNEVISCEMRLGDITIFVATTSAASSGHVYIEYYPDEQNLVTELFTALSVRAKVIIPLSSKNSVDRFANLVDDFGITWTFVMLAS